MIRSFASRHLHNVVSWNNPVTRTPMAALLTIRKAVNWFRLKPSDCDIVGVIL